MDAQGPPPDPDPDLITQATRTVREMTASIEVNRSLLTRAKERLQALTQLLTGTRPPPTSQLIPIISICWAL